MSSCITINYLWGRGDRNLAVFTAPPEIVNSVYGGKEVETPPP